MNTMPLPALCLLRRRPLKALLAFSLLITLPALYATVELPIEVFSSNGASAQKDVVVTVTGAPAARILFLEMHNLRYGGQASVQVNNDPWIDLHNHTVRVREKDRKLGGIGGLHGTIVMEVDLVTPVGDGSNTIRFRFNGTNGIVSTFRVLEFDFLKSDGTPVLGAGAFTYANPELWQKIYTGAADIQRGKDLFQGTTSPVVNLIDNVISNRPITATCSACHFKDGSDLHYFNYSNESIVTRAQFHGLTLVDSQKIASYVRSLNDSPANPNPGRPWDPPFQPGPGTDTAPATDWAAGKGLYNVLDSELASINQIFRPGSTDPAPITFTEIAKVMDHDGTFSVRNVALGIQFPDWNSWLPWAHPRDIWPSGPYQFMGSSAETAYVTLDTGTDTQAEINALKTATGGLRKKVGDFEWTVEQWLRQGCEPQVTCESSFRVYPGAPVIDARAAQYTSEEAKINFTKWLVMKTFEVVQTHGLYDETLTDGLSLDPMYRGEVLSWPADQQSVFMVPPHLTSNNKKHYEWQEQNLGKMMSHQWYMVQLAVNSGMRLIASMNTPLDWDYQINHTTETGDMGGGHSGIRQLLTMIKIYEVRANGNRLDPSTTTLIAQDGFSPRATHPWTFYSDSWAWKYSFKGAFEELQPDLWRRLFEELTYEWLDVLEKLNLSDGIHVPRLLDKFQLPPSNNGATPFTGVEGDEVFPKPAQDHTVNSFRLLPLADKEGVDKLTLLDFANWSKKAWTSPDFAGQVNLTKLVYHDNFEDNTVAFTGYTTIAIKDANYVNNSAIVPKRGGGKYVTQLTVAGGAATTNAATISQPLGGATKLRARARVAFDLSSGTPVAPQFKMNVAVDGGAVQAGAILALDPGLMEKKFVTYEHTFTVAGTNLTKVELYWSNPNAASGTAYVDNVEVLNVTPPVDSPAGPPPVPSTPVPTNTLVDHISIDWNDVVAADLAGYSVYRWRTTEAESTKQKLNNVLVTTSIYHDYAIQSGAEYYYRVSAVDTNGNESAQSAASAVAFYPGKANVLWAPSWLTASVVSNPGKVDLRWFAAAQTWDTKGYEILRKLSSGQTYVVISGANPLTTFTYQDAGVTPGTSYDYKVRTLDFDGNNSDNGPYVRTVLNVVPISAAPPAAPTGLIATPGTDRVVLSWTASSGAASYNVKRSTTSGGPYPTIAPGVIPTNYTDTTAVGGTTYYYVVSAVNAFGESANSNEASATPTSVPTFVAAGTSTSGTGTITPTLPAGIASGDILLLFVETANQAVSISNPNGGTWAVVTGSPQGTGPAGSTGATMLTVFWSRYNGTQGAPTISDSGNHQTARTIAIRGAAASGDPWNVTAGGVEATSDTSASIPGATTTVANTLVVMAVAGDLPDANGSANFSGWSNANLTNLTERTDDTKNSGNGGALGVATGEKTAAGAYGSTTVTHANAAVKGMISIAIKK